jgi:hypothetical protein
VAALDLAIRLNVTGATAARGLLGGVSTGLGGLTSALTAPLRAAGALVSGLGQVGLAVEGVRALASTATGLADVVGLGQASEMENLRAQFLAFTKDGAETDRLLTAFQARADKTPFALREIATAAAQLLPASRQANIGLDSLIDTAQLLAALNPAEGLAGGAFALREALSGDFVSIVERFNLPRQRLNQLKAQGVPAVQAINTVLKEMGVDASLVANLGATLTGRWSTFMDTIDGLRRTLATPLLEGIKEGLIELQGVLDANRGGLTEWARSAGQALGQLAGRVVAGIPFAVDAVRTLVGALSGSWRPAPGVAQFHAMVGQVGLAIAFARDAVATFIGAITGNWAGQASSAINPIHQAIGNIGLFIRTTVLPALADLGVWFAGPGQQLLGAFGGVIGTIVLPALGRLSEWFAKVGLPAIQAWWGWFSVNLLPGLLEFAGIVAGEVLAKVQQLGAWLATDGLKAAQAFGAWFQSDGVPLLQSFQGLAETIGGLLRDVFGPALLIISQNGAAVLREVGPLVTAFSDLLSLLEPLGKALGFVFGAIAAALPGLLRQLTGFITGLTGTVELVTALIGGLATAFAALSRGDAVGALGALQQTWTAIAAAMGKVQEGQQAIQAGQALTAAGQAGFAAQIGLGAPLPGAPTTARLPVQFGPPAPTPEELERQRRRVELAERELTVKERSIALTERWNQVLADGPTDLQIAWANALGT